ncbi:hypothetical protein HHK36_012150 [Tetracentron sinense]|uniref:Uncharacterized protein n=1 Tax=Tetracentron sinense TaxID=13715 RepID=A0A835DFG6_TETSI|nr:hypothetical protein HHK36_012150 [Tetracentron sinense]
MRVATSTLFQIDPFVTESTERNPKIKAFCPNLSTVKLKTKNLRVSPEILVCLCAGAMKRDQASDCDGCSSEERWVLHRVRHRGIYRRLCTSCVLNIFPGSFCPICYELHLHMKCPSISHLASDVAAHYLCPPCVSPSFLFFDVGTSNNNKIKGEDGAINHKSAKLLLAAAGIATLSMNKAVNTARRKGSVGVPGSVPALEQKKKPKGNSVVSVAVAAQKRIQTHLRGEGMDHSGGIPKSLNNAGSKWAGFQELMIAPGVPKNGVSNDEKERPINPPHLQNHSVQMEKEENSGLFSAPAVSVRLQNPQNSHSNEEGRGSKGFANSEMVPQLTHSNQDELVSGTNSGVPLAVSSDMAA